jgi:hypothetical protein
VGNGHSNSGHGWTVTGKLGCAFGMQDSWFWKSSESFRLLRSLCYTWKAHGLEYGTSSVPYPSSPAFVLFDQRLTQRLIGRLHSSGVWEEGRQTCRY